MQTRSYLKLSVAVAAATIALKGFAWWITGSVGLLSDALESLVNLAAAAFALAMVAIAAHPPDAEHPYGHHKAEYFSSGFEGMLILLASVGIGWAAIHRWLHPQPLQDLSLGIGLSVVSAVLNGALAYAMLKHARRARSIALEADAKHLYADVWTSVGVVAGLLGVQATGWLWLDPLAALLVACNVLHEGVKLVRRSTDGLMDHAADEEVQQRIATVLRRFEDPAIRFDDQATRRAGTRVFVDLHLHLPSDWTLRRAAELRAEVEQALMNAVPGLRASIQLLPTDVEAHVDRPVERT